MYSGNNNIPAKYRVNWIPLDAAPPIPGKPPAARAGYEVPDTSRVKTYYVVKNYRGHFEHDVIQLRSRRVYRNKNNIIYLFMTFEMFFFPLRVTFSLPTPVPRRPAAPPARLVYFNIIILYYILPTISTCGNCSVNYVVYNNIYYTYNI